MKKLLGIVLILIFTISFQLIWKLVDKENLNKTYFYSKLTNLDSILSDTKQISKIRVSGTKENREIRDFIANSFSQTKFKVSKKKKINLKNNKKKKFLG